MGINARKTDISPTIATSENNGKAIRSFPDLEMIKGCLIASDSQEVGYFESSEPELNKLWQNIRWTQWDNMISVPTDCPQRNERMGWMGDAQVFCQTSIFNLDMAAFYTKWIQDIRDDQRENGVYPDYPCLKQETDISLLQ